MIGGMVTVDIKMSHPYNVRASHVRGRSPPDDWLDDLRDDPGVSNIKDDPSQAVISKKMKNRDDRGELTYI